jgi:hypothetical protein
MTPRILVLLAIGLLLPLSAQALSTAFTYQGRLTQAGTAPTGSFDLQFTLYDAALDGTPIGTPVTCTAVPVTKGLFTVALDFGGASFPGDDRWLAIAVKPAGGETYTTLSPRQPLTPTPYALFARGVNWADIVGRPVSFGLYQAGSGLTLAGDTFSISAGAITDSMIGNLSWNKLTGVPTTFAPGGTAGGDLSGTYPNPVVGADKIGNSKLAADAASLGKVSGGLLTVNGPNVGIGTASPATKLDVNGTAKMTGFQLGSTATAGQVLTSSATGAGTWQALPAYPASLPPSGAAGGELAGSYPNPAIAVNAVTTAKLADAAVTTAKLADAHVTTAKLADNAVTAVKIVDGTVANADLAADSASLAKVSGGTLTVNGTNVGIGTASPTAKLEVSGTAKMTGFQLGATATAGHVLTTSATGVGTWQALPAAPSTLPPSGAAGGDLTGTYPNPTIAPNAVTTAKLVDSAITAAKIADAAVANADLAADSASLAKVSGGVMVSTGAAIGIGVTADLLTSGKALEVNGDVKLGAGTGPGPDSSAALDQQFHPTSGQLSITSSDLRQTFTPSVTGYLAAVKVANTTPYLTYTGLRLRIYQGEDTSVLLYTMTGLTMSGSGDLTTKINLDRPVPMTVGQRYGFRLDTGSPTATLELYYGANNPYANGQLYNGVSTTTADLSFSTYMQTVAPVESRPFNLVGNAVGINTATPGTGLALDVNGKLKATGLQLGSSATAGQVLTADATGAGTWQALPTTASPVGAAGGALTGTYPNPTIADNAVTSTKIVDANITTAKIADSAITAGKIADGAVANADLASDSASLAKVSGGAMAVSGTNVGIGTASPAAKLDVNGTVKATGFQLGTAATAGQVLTTSATGVGTWQTLPASPTTLPPSGTAGGDLTGTYPNPTVAAGKIDSTRLADNAVTTAKLADAAVTASELAANAVTTTKILDATVTTAKIGDGAITGVKLAADAVANTNLATDAGSLVKVSGGLLRSTGTAVGIGLTPQYTLHVNGTVGIESLPQGDRRNVQWDPTTHQLYQAVSSVRYKTNIAPLRDDFGKFLQLEPKTYNYKNTPTVQEIGYVAEDVDALGLTWLVHYDAQGRPDALKYEKMVLYLNEIAKQQQQQLTAQERRIGDLERRAADKDATISALAARLAKLEALLEGLAATQQ